MHFNMPGDKEAHSNQTKETGMKMGRKIGFSGSLGHVKGFTHISAARGIASNCESGRAGTQSRVKFDLRTFPGQVCLRCFQFVEGIS